MKTRLTVPLLLSALLLSGCGGFSDSGWNPLGWFGGGGSKGLSTLAPEGGFAQSGDPRPDIAQVSSAKWEPALDGRILLATANAPTKGYHDAALITLRPHPGGRIEPDEDGVLRLRFVAVPPHPSDPVASLPANPAVDSLTAALSLPAIVVARISSVEISGAANTITLRR